MKRSFLSKLSGAVVALALGTATLATVGAATPASAAPCATTAKLTITPYGKRTGVPYPYSGDSMNVSARVSSSCDSYPDGTVVLERATPGGKWAAIDSDDFASPYFSRATKYTTNAAYRIHYIGSGDFAGVSTYSAAVNVRVHRSVTGTATVKKNRGVFKITIAPSMSGAKLLVQVKKGKKWKKLRKVKVRGAGLTIKVNLPRRGRTNYRLVLPDESLFVGQKVPFWVKRG